MKVVTILIITVCIQVMASAQMPTKLVYGGIAASSYKGDLSGYEKWSSSFHLGLKLNQNHRINSNFNLAFGNITGQNVQYEFIVDQVPTTPNRFFKTNFFSVNYDVQVNIIKNENIIFYLSQGIGFTIFDPEDQFFNKLIDQENTRDEGESYSSGTLMLPTQIGIIYFLPNHFGIGFNLGILNTQTDYLDNISNWSVNTGNDNIIWAKLSFYVPISFKNQGLINTKKKDT